MHQLFVFLFCFFGKFHDILGAETLSGICDTGDKVDDDRNLKGKIKKRKFIHFLFWVYKGEFVVVCLRHLSNEIGRLTFWLEAHVSFDSPELEI